MLWTSFMLSHLWTDHLAHLPVLPTSLPCSGMLTPVGNWWGTYITGSAATGGARGDDDGEGKEDEERVWAVKAPSDDEEMDLEQESRGNKPMVTKDNSKWCPSATSLTLTICVVGYDLVGPHHYHHIPAATAGKKKKPISMLDLCQRYR